MEEVLLKLNNKGHGAFIAMDGEEQVGEMQVGIKDHILTAFHTEVIPKAEGKGWAKKLLNAMVDHARKNEYKVIPLCPYVLEQFKRHPEEFADIWKK